MWLIGVGVDWFTPDDKRQHVVIQFSSSFEFFSSLGNVSNIIRNRFWALVCVLKSLFLGTTIPKQTSLGQVRNLMPLAQLMN